jgi:hypothetical protein
LPHDVALLVVQIPQPTLNPLCCPFGPGLGSRFRGIGQKLLFHFPLTLSHVFRQLVDLLVAQT